MHYCRQPCCFLIAAIPMQTLVTVCWINCSTRKTATDLYLVYRYSCINIVTQQQILYAFYLLTPSCLYFSSYVIYCIGPHLTLWLPSFKPASLNIICTCMDALRENTQYCSFISSFQAQNDPFRLVRYDISLATHGLTQSQPLLLRRHNAVPGMFLVS